METTIAIGQIKTPLGPLGAVLTPAGLARLAFAREGPGACAAWAGRWEPRARIQHDDPRLDALAAELEEYFDGRLRAFTTPLDLRGTPFQLAVWRALAGIGYGETRAYSELAATLGRPQAVRAVGAANGANPIPILVPCHRLVGKGGSLVKYGGGLELKRWLLALEGATVSGERNRTQITQIDRISADFVT
jgi:O-6-methylguanine DNA methyltransferase